MPATGPHLVLRPRRALERARLGRGQRGPAHRGAEQVEFKLDYCGGWKAYQRASGRRSPTPAPVPGPPLPWQLCRAAPHPTAPSGHCRPGNDAPDYGVTPTQKHASGAPPLPLDRAARGAQRQARLGLPEIRPSLRDTSVYDGIRCSRVPVDGERVPLDCLRSQPLPRHFDSAYGLGWKRENSFLTHGPNGSFCYGFYPHGARPAGHGERYRATIIGPGVTPDVMWQGEPRTIRCIVGSAARRRPARALRVRQSLQARLRPSRGSLLYDRRHDRGGHVRPGRRHRRHRAGVGRRPGGTRRRLGRGVLPGRPAGDDGDELGRVVTLHARRASVSSRARGDQRRGGRRMLERYVAICR